MADPCNFCHGSRLVGWSGAGPILCPECSRGQDAFTVITQAWREQRARVRELEDCGQNGVCALSPGCIRHWQERNRELVTERERLNAIAYGESERAKELEAELAKLREERRWVPVEERLPKKQDHYLCGTRERDDVVLSWDGIAWDHPDDSLEDWEYWNAQVLRWMSLPAPPGEKGK